jgi:hypothetical protein
MSLESNDHAGRFNACILMRQWHCLSLEMHVPPLDVPSQIPPQRFTRGRNFIDFEAAKLFDAVSD